METIIRDLSIRGRIAYALICLHLLYEKFGLSTKAKEYKYLSGIFWAFIGPKGTSLNLLNLYMEFSYKYVVMFPKKNAITGNWITAVNYEEEKRQLLLLSNILFKNHIELPDIRNRQSLFENYYNSLPEEVCEAINYLGEIFEFGYDGGGENSNMSNSYYCLLSFISLVKQQDISVPNPSVVSFSNFSDNYGLGSVISKVEVENIIGIEL